MSQRLRSIKAVNVPDSLPHDTRANEIKALARYLVVADEQSDAGTLVHIGVTAPPADSPVGQLWLKLSAEGTVVGLFSKQGSEYVPADPTAPRAPAGSRILSGSATLILSVGAETVQRFSHDGDTGGTIVTAFGFDPKFVAGGTRVVFAIKGGTLTEDLQWHFRLWVSRVDADGFELSLMAKSLDTPEASPATLTLDVDFIAIGTEDTEEA